jgi:PAS domain S-box-containing protein
MLSPAFIAHHLLADESQILAVERFIHAAYVFLPAVNLMFFHHVLGLKRPYLTRAALLISFLLAFTVSTPWYFTGLHRFGWGSIARGGPAFFIFGLYSLIATIYFIAIFLSSIRSEPQPRLRLQRIFILISFGLMAVLTLLNVPAINGIDFYPAGNFGFVPLAVLAFGVRRYRLLDIDTTGRVGAAWLIPAALFALPNYLLFALVRPYFGELMPLPQFGLLLLWFYLCLVLLRKAGPLIDRTFHPERHFLNSRRLRFMDRMMLLHHLRDLRKAISEEVQQTLGYRRATVAMRTPDRGFSATGLGILPLPKTEHHPEMAQVGKVLERCRPEEWPEGSETAAELETLFHVTGADVVIPFAREGHMPALLLLSQREKDAPLSPEERSYLQALALGCSIAVSNSIMFQNIANLKDRLESQTAELQRQIAEREEAQRALQTSERQYRLLAENMKDIVWTMDIETLRFTYVSPSVELILGFTPEEQVKKTLEQMLTPESLERAARALRDTIRQERQAGTDPGGSITMELEQFCKNGSTTWVEVTASFLRDEKGKPVQILGVNRDITERRRRQEAQQAKLAAENANRAKSEFLANMSHELRTPLNHIIGFTEMMADRRFGPLNGIQIEHLNDVLVSSRHLLDLINDILDLSKVEAGKMTLEPEEVELAPLLEGSFTMIREKSLKKNLRMDLVMEGAPERVMVDPRKFRQVLYNLLANAVKFTPEGGMIRVNACSRSNGIENHGGPSLEVSVSDTGIGIREEDLERIFNSFEQVESSASRRYQGTGLGLALSRRLVELHGGRLRAESMGEGRGSRFTVTLPQ